MTDLQNSVIHPLIFERLKGKGIVELSLIQKESFSVVFEGKSVIAHSKTGTGKTLAYLMPLVQKFVLTPPSKPEISPASKVLVLVPTRELAGQAEKEVLLLTQDASHAVVIVGGENEEKQIQGSRKAIFVIATPGRLLDLIKRRAIDLSGIDVLVFDEADRLLDMGFIDDMREIVKRISKPSQQMLFYSATTHFGIEEMAFEFRSSEVVHIGQDVDEMTVEGLSHKVSFVGEHEKFHALVNFLHKTPGRGIVFSNYRDKAHDITYRLRGLGCRAEGLTAQLSQNARRAILEGFLKEKIQVLVASDLAARGIDVKDLQFVVNYDLPEDPSTYVHRVGRTARAGKKGEALSLVGFEDAFRLEKLEKFLGAKIERQSFEPSELEGPLPRWKQAPQVRSFEAQPRPERKEAPRPSQMLKVPQNTRVATPAPVKVQKGGGSIWDRMWTWFLSLLGRPRVLVSPKALPPVENARKNNFRPHSRKDWGRQNRGHSHRKSDFGGRSNRQQRPDGRKPRAKS